VNLLAENPALVIRRYAAWLTHSAASIKILGNLVMAKSDKSRELAVMVGATEGDRPALIR